jgi:hypothetical protein
MKLFLAALSLVSAAYTTMAGTIAVYTCTDSGKQFNYFTPESSANAPIYRAVTSPTTWYLLRDLDTGVDSMIRLYSVGSKKYYSVDLETTGNWDSIEPVGYPNLRKGEMRYPKVTYLVKFELDGYDNWNPANGDFTRITSFVFGVDKALSVGTGTRTMPSQWGGNSATWRNYEYTYVAPPTGGTSLYPYSGEVISVQSALRAYKFNATHTKNANIGPEKTVNTVLLRKGTRGLAAYQLSESLRRSGYLLAPQ